MLRVSLGDQAQAGHPASLRIEARDPGTGHPLTGLSPAVWLVPSDQATGACESWVNRLAGSPVAPGGVLDLNGYDIVQLTGDGALALVDPQLNLATANIKSVLRMDAPLAFWSTDPAGAVLALVEEATPSELRLLGYGPLNERMRIDAGSAITALSAGEEDIVVGTSNGRLQRYSSGGERLEDIAIGAGRVTIHRSEEGAMIAIAADGSGIIEGAEGHRIAFHGGPLEARDVAFAPLADGGLILSSDGRYVATLYRDSPERLLTQPLEREAARLVPDMQGRWIALPAADGLSVAIFDTRIGQVRWTIATEDPLRDVLFSDSFLYLTHAKAGGVTRVVFDPDGNQPGIAMIAAGEASMEERTPSRFPLIVRVPGAGVIAASPDRRIGYMVSEDGAQAAMSSVPLRAGDSEGILLRYRGTREAAEAGSYSVQFMPEYGGEYLAVVRLDQPAIAHCSLVSIAGPPDPLRIAHSEEAALAALPVLSLSGETRANDRYIEFSVLHLSGEARLAQAMLVREAGDWRAFLDPQPLGNNRFAANFPDAGAGRYRLFVELAQGRTLGTAVTLR